MQDQYIIYFVKVDLLFSMRQYCNDINKFGNRFGVSFYPYWMFGD